MARCWRAAPSGAAFSGATYDLIRHVLKYSFSPLDAGWDGAARLQRASPINRGVGQDASPFQSYLSLRFKIR